MASHENCGGNCSHCPLILAPMIIIITYYMNQVHSCLLLIINHCTVLAFKHRIKLLNLLTQISMTINFLEIISKAIEFDNKWLHGIVGWKINELQAVPGWTFTCKDFIRIDLDIQVRNDLDLTKITGLVKYGNWSHLGNSQWTSSIFTTGGDKDSK